MGFPVTQGAYNLLEEKWIPVLYGSGRTDRVGICKALEDAHNIRQIAASNPMDRVALLRFLLAVLMWCKKDAKSSLAALDEKSAGIPGNWLEKLKINKAAFNLLGDGKRFYQDKTILDDLLKAKQKKWDDQRKKAKTQKGSKAKPTKLDGEGFRPIGDLLIEFPTETKMAHFRHVRDKEYGFCPACCALGIIRFCSWANAYGGGRYTSAVNGPTPAYLIRHDSTLLRTFSLNCPENRPSNREAPWLCNNPPQEEELDVVAVFAWRSRKLWLADPECEKEPCSYCGETTHLIRKHAFTGNWKPPFKASGNDKKFWPHDPHLILVEKTQDSGYDDDSEESDDVATATRPLSQKGKRGQPQKTTLGFPSPGAKIATHTRFWRRALSAKFTSNTTESKTVYTTITGPAANKGLYQDATSVCLPRDCRSVMIETVRKAVENLSGVLRSSTSNPDRQHPERKAVLDALSPSLEASLKQKLYARLKLENFLKDWLQSVVQDVVSATTPGSPLRRRTAKEHAKALLNKKIKELVEEPDHPSNASTPASVPGKPKRGRRKGGSK
jgi:hypothetical protein